MTLSLDELERLAMAATMGPWRLAVDERQYTPEYLAKYPDSCPPRAIYGVVTQWIHGQLEGPVSITYTSIPMPGIYTDSSPRGSMDEKDAAYIAACDPGTILKLLAVVKAAKDAQEWIIDAQTGNALDKALREIE